MQLPEATAGVRKPGWAVAPVLIKFAKLSESQIPSVQCGNDSSPLVTGGVNEGIFSERLRTI